MSEYFSPYSPPGGGMDPYGRPFVLVAPEALRAARRASTVMFILCAIALACSMLFFLAWMMPLDAFRPDQRQALEKMTAQSGMPLKAYFLGGGLLALLPALMFGLMGIWVRSGQMAAIVTAMVSNGLLLVFLALSILAALGSGEGGGPGAAIAPMAIAAIMIWLMRRLAAAARAARQANFMSAQYQAQFWQQPFEADGGYAPAPPVNPPTEPK